MEQSCTAATIPRHTKNRVRNVRVLILLHLVENFSGQKVFVPVGTYFVDLNLIKYVLNFGSPQ